MKSKLILLLLIFSSGLSFSQRVEVNLGPLIDSKAILSQLEGPKIGISLFNPYSVYRPSIFFNTQSKRTYFEANFSKSLQFILLEDYVKFSEVKTLTAEFEQEKVHLISVTIINNKMYVFYGIKYPKTDELSVFVNEVSPEMVVLGSPIIIHTFKNIRRGGTKIAFIPSKNKKSFLIARLLETKDNEDENEKQKIHCKVINESFGAVWDKEVDLDDNDEQVLIKSWEIDNSGNFYLLTEYKKGFKTKPVLHSYFWKSKSWKTINLGLPTGDNFGTNLELLNGDDPYMVGLNESEKKVTYFINKINTKTENIELLGSNPMPENFFKESRKDIYTTKHWRVVNMVSLENNTLAVSIEAELVKVNEKNVPIAYLNNDAYVVAFGVDGGVKWSHVVQKDQSSRSEMVGHLLLPAKDKVLVIYNDHPDNFVNQSNEKRIKEYTGLKEALVVVHEIDAVGKVTKYPLSEQKEFQNCSLFISGTCKIEDNLFFVPAIYIKGILSVESRNMTLKIN